MARAGNASALPKLRQESLAQQAFQEVKAAILSGAVASGAVVSEIELAEAMGISRTPVREALAMLRSAGLIESIPGGGHMVRSPGVDEVRELFMIRESLECLALREFVEGEGERDLDTLTDLIEQQRQANENRDTEAFLETDAEFHVSICRQAGLPQVVGLLTSLREKMRQAGLRAIARPDRIPHVLREHQAVVDALRAGDPAGAQEAMRTHLDATQRSLEAHFETEPSPDGGTQGGTS